MPWSSGQEIQRDALTRLSARAAAFGGVLDCGAGAGIWRDLARDLPIGARPWHAAEVFQPYFERFGLADKYDLAMHRDLRRLKYGIYRGWAVLFGDVLEHLERLEAVEIVRRAGSVATVVVMMPFVPSASAEQGACEGNPWEAHRYVWRWSDWLATFEALVGRVEVVAPPPGSGRNKGCLIGWHGDHDA
jgi:hypothetical protein